MTSVIQLGDSIAARAQLQVRVQDEANLLVQRIAIHALYETNDGAVRVEAILLGHHGQRTMPRLAPEAHARAEGPDRNQGDECGHHLPIEVAPSERLKRLNGLRRRQRVPVGTVGCQGVIDIGDCRDFGDLQDVSPVE